jgi:hypothetical protein
MRGNKALLDILIASDELNLSPKDELVCTMCSLKY